MNQDDIERRLSEIFGAGAGRTAHTQGPKEIDNPAYVPPGTPGYNPTIPPKLTVTEEVWKDASGNQLTIQRWPDGTVKETGATTAPANGRASTDESVSAPPTQPNIVTRKPDGSIQTIPNPNYQPPGAAEWHTEGTPDGQGGYDNSRPIMVRTVNGVRETRQPTGAELKDWNEAQQRSRNPGGKTDAEIQAEADRNKGTTTLKPDGKGGTIAVTTYPDGRAPTTQPVPGVPSEATSKYSEVKQDPATGQWLGLTKDGKWEPISGGPGTGAPRGTAGPTMPQIVLGHSQEAAQQYKQLLQQGVASGQWSQQWADQRWGEFMQVANLAVSEAATQQRDIESTRNAQINVATSRASYGQNAMKDALAYAQKINGLAPAGSQNLGGQAFATMMGLSMLMEARSGLDSVSPTSTARSQIPQVTTSTISNPQALADTRAQLAAANAQHQAESAAAQAASAPSATQPAATAARPSASAAPAQNAGAGTGEPPARSNLPAQPTTTTAAATKPMYRVDLGDELVYYDAAQHPEMATASGVTLIDAPATWSEGKREPKSAAGPAYAKPGDIPAASPQPSDLPPGSTPDYGQPGMRVLPQPQPDQPPQQSDAAPIYQGDPSVQYGTPETMQPGAPIQVPGEAPGVSVPYPSTAGAESYAPPPSRSQGGEYAVLQPYLQQSSVQPTQQPAQPQQDSGMPVALLHAQAASTPFWRLSAEQIQQMRAAGIDDSVIMSPGRGIA